MRVVYTDLNTFGVNERHEAWEPEVLSGLFHSFAHEKKETPA